MRRTYNVGKQRRNYGKNLKQRCRNLKGINFKERMSINKSCFWRMKNCFRTLQMMLYCKVVSEMNVPKFGFIWIIFWIHKFSQGRRRSKYPFALSFTTQPEGPSRSRTSNCGLNFPSNSQMLYESFQMKRIFLVHETKGGTSWNQISSTLLDCSMCEAAKTSWN